MAHIRQQIRHAVAEALVGLTTTGARVFRSRAHRLKQSDMPGLCIYTPDEDCRTADKQGGQDRRITLVVEGHAAETANLDDTLDQMAAEVEAKMFSVWSLGGLVTEMVLTSTTSGIFAEDDKGNRIDPAMGIVRLTFIATTMTTEGAPGTVTA